MVSGRTFHAWLELAVASRTDPELARAVTQLTARLRALTTQTFHELFDAAGESHPFFAVAPSFIFALLEGLSLGRIAGVGEAETDQVIEAVKVLTGLVMPSTREST
jgi:hypothetical protein